MNKKIYLSPPHLTEEAMVYLKDAVDSNWIAPVGPHVDAFEAELASILGVNHVLVTNSATSAIHLGLIALGVERGDEVLCSTFTFCASVNPVMYCGAKPVFIDSEPLTWNMDPVLLEEAILDRIKQTGNKPKAIVLVHLYGMPARLKEIIAVTNKYDIPLLEDAAEAFGSSYEGRQVGTLGQVGVISFNGNKIITTSGGGVLFSSNGAIIEKAAYLRQEAREPRPYYEHKAVGYNYRMSNLLAAVGRSQLKVLQERVRKRRAIFNQYRSAFDPIPFLKYQEEFNGAKSNRWLTVINMDDYQYSPEALRTALEQEGIETRPAWKPMHLQPVYQGFPAYLKGVSENIFNKGLCLPSGSSMTTDDVDRVVGIVKSLLK